MSVCCRNISPWVHPRSSRMQSQNISYNLRLLSISKVIISDISQNDKETRKFKIIKYFSLVNTMSTRKNIDRSFHWISNSRFHDETEPWLVRTRTPHITLDALCVPCPRATDSVSVVYTGIPHRFNTSLCVRSRPSRLIYLVWLRDDDTPVSFSQDFFTKIKHNYISVHTNQSRPYLIHVAIRHDFVWMISNFFETLSRKMTTSANLLMNRRITSSSTRHRQIVSLII